MADMYEEMFLVWAGLPAGTTWDQVEGLVQERTRFFLLMGYTLDEELLQWDVDLCIQQTALALTDLDLEDEEALYIEAKENFANSECSVFLASHTANGMMSFFQDQASKFVAKCMTQSLVEVGIPTFLTGLKEQFDGILGDFSELIHRSFGWLRDIWKKFSSWATTILETLCGWAFHVLDGLVISIALVGVTLMLHGLEKFLLMTGMIEHEWGWAKMFAASVGAILCLRVVSAADESKKKVFALMNTLAIEVLALFPNWSWGGFFPQDKSGPFAKVTDKLQLANFDPVGMISQVAKVVTEKAAGAVIETGKFFSAVSAIQRGLGTVKDVACTLLRFFSELVGKALGKESKFLGDAATIVGFGVESWLRSIDQFARSVSINVLPSDFLEIGDRLRRDGDRMIRQLAQPGVKLSTIYLQMVVRNLEKHKLLMNQLERAGEGLARVRPFCVAFVGPSRSGKSEMRERMEKRICAHFERPGSVFVKPKSDQYWTNYHHQLITSFDDLGSMEVENGKTDEAQFVDLISGAPLALNMADLESKGTYFSSRFVLYSSNFEKCSPGSGVKLPVAFNNRRDLVLKVVANGKPYDPRKPWESCTVSRLTKEAMHLCDLEVADGETLDDVIFKLIVAEMEPHFEKEQERLRLGENVSLTLLQQVVEIGKSFSLCNQMLGHITERVMAQHKDYLLVGAHHGKIWAAKKRDVKVENLEDVTHWFKLHEREHAADDCRFFCSSYKLNYKVAALVSPLADRYFQDLIENDCVGSNNEAIPCLNVDCVLAEELLLTPTWFRCVVATLHDDGTKKGSFVKKTVEWAYEQMHACYATDVARWPLAMKMLVGGTVLACFGTGVTMFFKSLCTAFIGTNSVVVDSCANSDPFGKFKKGNHDVGAKMFKNRKIQARYHYGNSGSEDSLTDDAVQLMNDLLVEIRIGGKSMMVVAIPGRRFMMLRHYFNDVESKRAVQLVYADGLVVPHILDPKCFIFLEGSELCFYENHTLRQNPSNGFRHFCFDVSAEFGGEKIEALSLTYNPLLEDDRASYFRTVATVHKKKFSIDCGAYINELDSHISYEGPNLNGDCGSLLVARDLIHHRLKVIGVHVAGNRIRECTACLVPRFKDVRENFLNDVEVHCANNLGTCLKLVGEMKPEKRVQLHVKTSFEKVPEEWIPEGYRGLGDKEPCVLSSKDPRLTVPFAPYKEGMMKMAEGCGQLDVGLVDTVVDQMVEAHNTILGEKAGNWVDLDVALNGECGVDYSESLVLSTSEGYPHVLDRGPGEKGKYRFVEGPDGARVLKPGTSVSLAYDALLHQVETEVPELVTIEHLKDEKVVARKIYEKPKTRLFSVLPFEFNLMARQLFLPYMMLVMSNLGTMCSKVGINAYSRQWHELGSYLREQGSEILCCDYSLFDGLMTGQLMEALCRIMDGCIEPDKRRSTMRRNLLSATVSRWCIANNFVYKAEGGMPSGFAMTVILNSLLNEFLVRYHFLVIMKDYPAFVNRFDKLVRLAVYGDDNLIAVDPVISKVFNGENLRKSMWLNNIKITDGTDKTLPELHFHELSTVDFLKRKFVWRNGVLVGPLDMASLFSQIEWVHTKHMTAAQAFLEAINNVARELFLHSEDKCRDFLCAMRAQNRWIKQNDLLTIGAIKEFHHEQQTQVHLEMTDFEIVANPSLFAAFQEKRPTNFVHFLCDNIGIISRDKVHNFDEEDVLMVGMQFTPSVTKAEGMSLSWPIVRGVGMMPSADWFERNVLRPRSNLSLTWRRALSAGKRVIFVSQEHTVKCSLFALTLAMGSGQISRLVANEFFAEMVAQCEGLGYCLNNYVGFF